ncbi:hypothetical protein GCM10011506_06980 [Marivirga lumbricoides]|uniref:Secretion system C-terminal sorting domain-containing protein n=2 Tax=Marivirga lumbricoides TaxID=1046115 RepID=A0ABQ1LIT9_9BACT|nr:hypothetical protein GCM10011506_06980 [Marivirga lumbricoides]
MAIVSSSIIAQRITVTGGPGRVNDNTVIKGLPFTASVTGLNGTPSQWSVGIGTVNGVNIFNTSSTNISNAIVSREIQGSTSIISVGATNGNGVVRYLNVQDPPVSCTASLVAFAENLGRFAIIDAQVLNAGTGATFSWSISPNATILGSGSFVTFRVPTPSSGFRTYTISVTISGGPCDGQTFSTNVTVRGGIIPLQVNSEVSVFPNPSNTGSLSIVNKNTDLEIKQITLINEKGELVNNYNTQSTNDGLTIDTNRLVPGTYLIKLQYSDDSSETRRVLLE